MDIVLAYANELALAIGGIVLTVVLSGGIIAITVLTRNGDEALYVEAKED